MDQLAKVLWAIDHEITVPQKTLDCGPGFCRLNQVCVPNCPTASAQSFRGKNNNLLSNIN